jgi:hypothetical protein
MKLSFALLLMLCLAGAPLAAQEIYKVVDADGNVIYTDKKPSDDADPMDLPEISIIGEDVEEPPVALAETELERETLEFSILSPEDGQDILVMDNTLTVNMVSNIALPETARIVVYLNDEAQPPVSSLEATLEDVESGEHTLRAELQTPAGRVLASTDPISFRLHSIAREQPATQ